MYSDIFPVKSSQLDPKALLKAMNERYEVNVENCRLWNPGVNDVYILWTNIGTLYLRVSHLEGNYILALQYSIGGRKECI